MPTLPERLLLLSLDDDGQPRDPMGALGYALAGAALTELLLAGRLAHRDDRLQVASPTPTGDPVLDEVLRQVGAEEKPRKLQWWVYRLGTAGWRRPAVRDRLIDHLTSRGVLTRDEERLLGLIRVTRHPPAEATADDQARAEVRAVLVGGGREPDEATAALVALVDAAGLVDVCVDRSERRQARQRASQIAAGDQVGEAVRRIQQEIMAAITVAITAATTTVITSGGDGGGS